MPWTPTGGYTPSGIPPQVLIQLLLQQAQQRAQPQQQGGNPIEGLIKGRKGGSIFDSLFGGSTPFQGSVAATPFGSSTAGASALESVGLGGLGEMPLGMSSGSIEGLAGQGVMPSQGFSLPSGAVPIAGLAGIFDVLKNKRKGARGIIQGAGSGVAAGSYFGPVGMIAGGVLGAGTGIYNTLKKSAAEKEKNRWSKAGIGDQYQKGHDYFAGTGGEKSRDERFLTADAIRINPDNLNADPLWNSRSKEQQNLFLNDLLQNGKVQERKGGIYYDDDYAKEAVKKYFTAPQQVIPKAMIPRKDSPGFKDGKRINYNRR